MTGGDLSGGLNLSSRTTDPGIDPTPLPRSPTLRRILIALGFGLPVIAYFWLIHHYGVNAIWYDQWDDINVIAHPTLSNIWAQHNEDRIVFPNLIVLALAHTTHFNVHIEDYLNGVLLTASATLLVMTHKRRSPATPWLFYVPVAVVMFSFVQVGNTLFGFQLAWYLVMLTLAGTLYLLDKPELSWLILIGAIGIAVVGSLSSLQGLLIWPTGLILLFYRRRANRMLVAWIASAIATVLLYSYHFSSTVGETNNTYVFSHPVTSLEFFFSAIGDVVGEQLPYYGRNNVVIAFGVAIVAVAIWVMVIFGSRRNDSGSPIGVALTCFGLLFAVTITTGRTAYGLWYADSSRYSTFDLFILMGTYLTVLEARPLRSPLAPPGAATASKDRSMTNAPLDRWAILRSRGGRLINQSVRFVRVFVVGSILVLATLGTRNGLSLADGWHGKLTAASNVTVNIKQAPNSLVSAVLYPLPLDAVGFVRRMARVVQTQGLSMFATSTASQYAKEGLPPGSNFVARMGAPKNGATLKGLAFLDGAASVAFGSINVNASKVEFEITGKTIQPRVIGPGGFTIVGWLAAWSTTSVPNGEYEIRAVAHDYSGQTTYSPGVTVTVAN
jgi:hypothetical protein